MEDNIRTRNAALLFKQETTEETDASPTAAADAVRVENIQVGANPKLERTAEHTGSLDGAGSIVGGMTIPLSFSAYLKGSGSVSSAPEVGPLMKTCGYAETIQAAVPGTAEAVGSGSTTTAVVLGAGASSTDDAYNGMPLQLSGDMTDLTFIADYDGATKTATVTDTLSGTPAVATTTYQVLANVLYSPASLSIPTGTGYVYRDGILWKLVGIRGNVGLEVATGGIGKLNFSLVGLFASKTDVAVPSGLVFDTTVAPIFIAGAFKLNRGMAAISRFTLATGNTLATPPDPNAAEGFNAAVITARDLTGEVDPQEALTATRALFADFRAGTKRIMHARYGLAAGNRVAITVPNALYTGQDDQDREGIAAVRTPFEATGQDDGAHLCFY